MSQLPEPQSTRTPAHAQDPGEGADAARTARHDIENHLTQYTRAVDAHDLEAVVDLLSDAAVTFGATPIHGRDALTDAYGNAFTTGGRTRHLLHTLDVCTAGNNPDSDPDSDPVFVAWTPYQRWSLTTEPPTLTALGHYTARFTRRNDTLRLTSLTVSRDWQA